MKQYLADFLAEDSGAVTVDWVVLTAAIVGLGMIVLVPIATSTNNVSQRVSDNIAATNVGFTSAPAGD